MIWVLLNSNIDTIKPEIIAISCWHDMARIQVIRKFSIEDPEK